MEPSGEQQNNRALDANGEYMIESLQVTSGTLQVMTNNIITVVNKDYPLSPNGTLASSTVIKYSLLLCSFIVLCSCKGKTDMHRVRSGMIPDALASKSNLCWVWSAEMDSYDCASESNKYKLLKLLHDPCLRSNCYSVLKYNIHKDHLSFEDQCRLATMLRCLTTYQYTGEWADIAIITRSLTNHPSAYLHMLSAFDPFIVETMYALNFPTEYVAEEITVDGVLTNTVVRERAKMLLTELTKLDFGYNYDKWTNWWYSEGIHMEYDYKALHYKKRQTTTTNGQ